MHSLNQMRIDVKLPARRHLEEMTDYYTMWAHQIKTPIFALRLLLQESPEENKENFAELFKIEQYVEMVLGYLRTEDMSSDLKLSAVLLTGSYVIRFINMQEFLSQRNLHLLMKEFRRMF